MSRLPSPSDLESIRLLVNNQPIDDFEGLSPSQMNELLYNPFNFTSPLYLPDEVSDEILNRIPFFRLMEEFLKIIDREQSIKITPTGFLQKVVFTELYAHGFVLSDGVERGIHKLTREQDWNAVMAIHDLANMMGLIRKMKGGYVLTRLGKNFINPEKRNKSFRELIYFFTSIFSWSNFDGYSADRVGQLGWGFTLLLLLKHGNEQRSKDFYAAKYLKAFPAFVDQMKYPGFGTPVEYVSSCYKHRTFACFLDWWGFIEYEGNRFEKGKKDVRIVASSLLKYLFSLAE